MKILLILFTMQNKFRFLIVFVVLVISFQSNGQGFRGKRSTITYQLGFSNFGNYFDFSHLLYHNKVNYGYTLNNNFSVHFLASYLHTKLYHDLDYGYKTVQIQDLTLGMNFSYFFKNQQYFSPIGKYVGLGIEYGRQNSLRTVIIPEQAPDFYEKTEYYYDGSNGTTSLMLLYAYFGRNLLYKEKLMLGYSFQFGVTTAQGPSERQWFKYQINVGYLF